MPELPEVETIRRQLQEAVVHKKIKKIIILSERAFFRKKVINDLETKLIGKSIKNITRKGKCLIFEFTNYWLIVRLGMSGRLLFVEHDKLLTHTHLVMKLEDGRSLCYVDPRAFGGIELITIKPGKTDNALEKIGIDWLSEQVTPFLVTKALKKSKMPIRNWLLDQRKFSGLGNIYVSEALFRAGIHPLKSANQLSKVVASKLLTVIREVLNAAIKEGGTTFRDYLNLKQEPGAFQELLLVYDRFNQPCSRCKGLIERIKMTGRFAYYCPKCQKR